MTKIEPKSKNRAVIVANGRYPNHPIPLSIIENAPYVICSDGAANNFIALGNIPDAIVGDCDSVSEENKIKYSDIIFPDTEQESNDLTKSVRFAVKRDKTDIIIVGGTGMREDHTIGNISLLAEYALIADVKMVTNSGIFTPVTSTTRFNSFKGEPVSIFSIDRKPITTKGLKYSINKRILTNWWEGTLNVSEGDSFTIETEGRVIVFQVFKD